MGQHGREEEVTVPTELEVVNDAETPELSGRGGRKRRMGVVSKYTLNEKDQNDRPADDVTFEKYFQELLMDELSCARDANKKLQKQLQGYTNEEKESLQTRDVEMTAVFEKLQWKQPVSLEEINNAVQAPDPSDEQQNHETYFRKKIIELGNDYILIDKNAPLPMRETMLANSVLQRLLPNEPQISARQKVYQGWLRKAGSTRMQLKSVVESHVGQTLRKSDDYTTLRKSDVDTVHNLRAAFDDLIEHKLVAPLKYLPPADSSNLRPTTADQLQERMRRKEATAYQNFRNWLNQQS
eukprot:Filipodium_phascolosomae@DN5685_c0_g1_i1.p1